MAGIDFDGQFRLSTFRTAGWFWLSFPFIAAIGLVFGACLALVARKKRWLILCVMIAGCVWLIFKTGTDQLPKQRIQNILGPIAILEIHQFTSLDSFNGGITSTGIVSAPPGTIEKVATERSLKLKTQASLARMQESFPTESIPDYGDVYTNGWFTCFLEPGANRLYFRRHYMDAIEDARSVTDQ